MFMNYPAPKNIDPAGGQPSSVSPFHFPATKAALAPLHLPQIPPPFSYLSAALVVLSAAFFQYSLTPGSALAPFVFFFPGVCAVTFFGGFLPGVLSVVLSALIGNFLFIGPGRAWSLSAGALIATFSFVLSSSVLVLISSYFRRILLDFNQAVREKDKAEEAIRRADEEWNLTFDAISDLTFIQDKNFGIVKVNRAFADILKSRPEDIIGKKCYEVLHGSGQPWANCPFEKTRVDRQAHTGEVIDPSIGRPLLVTTSPIFNQQGEFLGSIHIAKDITELKRAEEALRKSEAGMKRAQEMAHLGAWELDLTNNRLTWSEEVYRIFGLNPKEFAVSYENFLDLVHPEDRQLVESAYSESIKQGKDAYDIEHRLVRKSTGEVRIVYEKCQNLKDESGRIIRSIGMVHDITERKQIEERLRLETIKDEALLSSIGDSIVAVDIDGKILFINNAFSGLVKKTKADLLGMKLDEALVLENEKRGRLSVDSMPISLALANGQKISSNIFSPNYYLRQGSHSIPLAITATPVIIDNKIIGAIAVYRDITKEKAIDQAKTEFVSLASHQLRTPLSSIALSTELLLRGVAGELSPEQEKFLNETYKSSKIMAELIKVLLDISRIELGTFLAHPEPVNVVESVDYLLDELDLQLKNKKLFLQKNYANCSLVYFDKNILRTTVENLITNAIRYTPAGGTITVSLEENSQEILLKVSDTGCGIPQEDKNKIFAKLYRAENAKQICADGTGLGLYLVKSLLSKAGSRIWYESELGKGTAFLVSIPKVSCERES